MSRPLHLLLVDDNSDDRKLVLQELRAEFPDVAVEQITDAPEFASALDRGTFGLAMIDYKLRWFNGIAVLKTVKTRRPDCPVILLVETALEEVAVEAMKLGLDDYIVKEGGHFVRIRAAVRSVLEKTRTNRRVAELESRLKLLLNRLTIGEFQCNPDGELLNANESFHHLLRLDSPEKTPIVESPKSLLELDACLQLLKRPLKTGQSQEAELHLPAAGQSIWLRLTLTPTKTPDGGIVVDGWLEDITAQKRSDEELRERAAVTSRIGLLSPR